LKRNSLKITGVDYEEADTAATLTLDEPDQNPAPKAKNSPEQSGTGEKRSTHII